MKLIRRLSEASCAPMGIVFWNGLPLLFLGCLFLGCEVERKKPNVELVQDMMESPAIKSQDFDMEIQPDHRAMRVPPENTVARGFNPYTITDSLVAEKQLVNPIVGREDVIPRGQKLYQTYCFVCHGPLGHGNGPICKKWIAPIPSLMSSRIREWKDGGIFHLITRGRGLMNGYITQITSENDRWAIVNYLRHVQKTEPVVETPAAKMAECTDDPPAASTTK